MYIAAKNYQIAWVRNFRNGADAIKLRRNKTFYVPSVNNFIDAFDEVGGTATAHGGYRFDVDWLTCLLE